MRRFFWVGLIFLLLNVAYNLILPPKVIATCECWSGQHGDQWKAGCYCSGNQCTYENGPPTNEYTICEGASQEEARDCACGGSGPAPICQSGTCDNSTCGANGACSCNDFGSWREGCEQHPGCWWNTYGSGFCDGRYCCGDGDVCFGQNKDYCQAKGCNWSQWPDNICADTSPCSLNGALCGQMQCLDRCTNTLVNNDCSSVACSQNNSACVSNTIPLTMSTGQTANVSVTMKNTGTTNWINSGSHPEILGSRNTPASLWGGTAVGLSTPIAPETNATFNFNITAPTTPGTYPNYWQMASGSDWFGAICGPSTVTVNQSTCTISGGKYEYKPPPEDDYLTTAFASSRALWLGSAPNQQAPISIRASGTAEGGVYPTMTLKVGNDSIKSWTVTNTLLWYTTTVPNTTPINQVSVHLYDSSGNRNLQVDLIQVRGITYQTEGDSVYGEGINVGGSCQSGTLRSEWLSCNNGFFRFTNLGTTFDPVFNFYALRNIPAGAVTVNSETTDNYTTSYRLGTSGNFTDGNTISFTCAPNSVNYLYWAYTCNPSAPAAITPSFPTDDATGVATTPTLGWHTETDWGKACANPANTYSTIYSLCQGDVTYPNWKQTLGCSTQITNGLTGTLQTIGPLEPETTYHWSVRGNNGQSMSPTWTTWSFTTLPPTWWQVMGGDVAGTIVKSDIPSGAANPYINRKSY